MRDIKKQNDIKKDISEQPGILDKIKSSFTGRRFRSGAYATILSTIVIVLVLVVNLIVSELDLKVDLTTQNIYTLTDSTVGLVKNLKEDVTIYYLAESGYEETAFRKIAGKYDSLSDHIKVVNKDPILYPKFAAQYVDNEITANSFIVVNDMTGRARYIDNSELTIEEIDYNTFESYTTGIDAEGKLTAAIQYVTDPDLPVIYATTGHSEVEAGELFLSILEKQNVTVNTVQTLTTASIPKDCDILLINSPESDFSNDEMTMIKEYMAAGGDAVIVLDYMADSLNNVKSLLEYYGLQLKEGIVCEGDSNRHVPQYPHYIIPEVISHDITSTVMEGKKIVTTPVSSGLVELDGIRSSLTIEPLLVTSEKAYSKVNINSQVLAQELGDIEGSFYLGVLSSDTYNNITSNLIVYTSEQIFHDNYLQDYGNADLLKSTVNYLSGDFTAVSVKTRSFLPEIIILTEQQAALWGALVVIIVPVLILTAGIIVNVRRRKR